MLAACVALGVATGAAAEYPDRPLRLVVPQAAGSATDTVARILAPEMAKPLGQQVVVDLGSDSQRQVEDYHLSRFACYLIAQNGDPRKPELPVGMASRPISL